MRCVVQRVSQASVTISGEIIGAITRGLLVLAGFEDADSDIDLAWMTGKLLHLRIFPDQAGRMNRSVSDCAGGILVISQFTLFASYQNGNRPSYLRAARPERATPLYEAFLARLSANFGHPVVSGQFGADMQVALINDGPVTIVLDSREPE